MKKNLKSIGILLIPYLMMVFWLRYVYSQHFADGYFGHHDAEVISRLFNPIFFPIPALLISLIVVLLIFHFWKTLKFIQMFFTFLIALLINSLWGVNFYYKNVLTTNASCHKNPVFEGRFRVYGISKPYNWKWAGNCRPAMVNNDVKISTDVFKRKNFYEVSPSHMVYFDDYVSKYKKGQRIEAKNVEEVYFFDKNPSQDCCFEAWIVDDKEYIYTITGYFGTPKEDFLYVVKSFKFLE